MIDTAEPWGQAQFEQRALGFVLAREDPILLTDQDSGARGRLAAREAEFVPDGIWQRRESLDASPTTDYRIALVPAPKASDAGGDTLIFAGNPFTVPPGARDLDLVSGRLFAGQTDSLPDTASPRSSWRPRVRSRSSHRRRGAGRALPRDKPPPSLGTWPYVRPPALATGPVPVSLPLSSVRRSQPRRPAAAW